MKTKKLKQSGDGHGGDTYCVPTYATHLHFYLKEGRLMEGLGEEDFQIEVGDADSRIFVAAVAVVSSIILASVLIIGAVAVNFNQIRKTVEVSDVR